MRLLVFAMMLAGPVWADPQTEALALVNAARVQAGCGALVIQGQLQAAAEGHARAMAAQNFFDHWGKDGSKMQDRIAAQGYHGRALAENIAAGQETAALAVQAWLNSPGHRRNMLNCAYRDTGLARVDQPDDQPLPGKRAAYRFYWVQVFGG